MQLYFACMCTHESLPPGRSGGGGSMRRIMNQICVGTVRFSTHACVTSKCCAFGIQHICMHHACPYICLGHIHAVVVFGHSPSLGYHERPIYSWARVDVHHFDQQRERGYQGGFFFSWFALPYSRTSIMVRFET